LILNQFSAIRINEQLVFTHMNLIHGISNHKGYHHLFV